MNDKIWLVCVYEPVRDKYIAAVKSADYTSANDDHYEDESILLKGCEREAYLCRSERDAEDLAEYINDSFWHNYELYEDEE